MEDDYDERTDRARKESRTITLTSIDICLYLSNAFICLSLQLHSVLLGCALGYFLVMVAKAACCLFLVVTEDLTREVTISRYLRWRECAIAVYYFAFSFVAVLEFMMMLRSHGSKKLEKEVNSLFIYLLALLIYMTCSQSAMRRWFRSVTYSI